MVSYLLKILALAIFSFIVIFFYYFTNNSHVENFDWYFPYIVIIWIIYAVYKYFQLEKNDDKVEFSLLKIIWFFLLHLFILSSLFFFYNWDSIWGWVELFFKIIFYSFFPILVILISIWFWKKIISFLPHAKEETDIYRFILSIWIWFFSFLFLVDIFWILGFYNIYVVLLIFTWFVLYSYKELVWILNWILEYKVELNIEEWSYLKLISTEFLFLVSTLVLSISLISIVRPFPIWWDDLWVYMNHPHLMAEAWTLMSFWSMQAWQTFTWIGYMFGSPTQAFFINNVWWFLSFILIVLITSDLLKPKIKNTDINQKLGYSISKTFLNIPLLIATLFIVMPMVIFEQAKDMKLDPGLFFVSIIVLYLLFKTFRKTDSKTKFISNIFSKFLNSKNKDNKINDLNYFLDNNDFLTDTKVTYKLIFIIGLLVWFAFTIKFTSLLLLLSTLWLLCYTEIWFAWLIGFLWLFAAFFTKFWLWSYMNIAYDKSNIVLVNYFSLISFLIWISFITIWFLRHKEKVKRFLVIILFFLLWSFISLAPWVWKNIVQSYPNISIWSLLWWKSESFNFDKTLILSDKKIKEIDDKIKKDKEKEAAKWISNNEDWGRYFGYEKWINNFVKLPWNLTMQKNQWGEFTDIWFLFLALLPAILLFLPFRNKIFYFTIVGLLLLELAVFQFWFFSLLLSSITLPFGYLVIFSIFFLGLLFFLYWLDGKKDENIDKINLFKLNLIFATFYTFLWSISAYWVVWYWIVMYFSFLLMIAISLHYLAWYKEDDWEKIFYIKLFWTLVFSLIIVIYFVNSVFPHSFNNLKNSWYKEFKTWQVKTIAAPFVYHSEYLKILYALNIYNTKKEAFLNEYINDDIKKAVSWITKMDIYSVKAILVKIIKDKNWLSKSAQTSLTRIYKYISNPPKKYRNELWIYRIGTFLAYNISENNKRLLWDSLIFNFNNYIYNKDINKTVSNLKKLWAWYLLVDLNAATIDKDARHNLTKRYEKLLSTFRSDKLKLVETDSICLKVALESYNKSSKTKSDIKNYMTVAWVNYESYDKNWKQINRWKKLYACYQVIKWLIENNYINKNNYSYLLNIDNYIRSNLDKFKSQDQLFLFLQKYVPHGYKVLFKIK